MTPEAAQRAFAALKGDVEAALQPALDRVAETVAANARRQLGTGGGPGRAPNDPSGKLAAAITAARDGDGATVRVAAPFAADLEYGTTRMAARPFLRPALAASDDESRAILMDALRRALGQDGP